MYRLHWQVLMRSYSSSRFLSLRTILRLALRRKYPAWLEITHGCQIIFFISLYDLSNRALLISRFFLFKNLCKVLFPENHLLITYQLPYASTHIRYESQFFKDGSEFWKFFIFSVFVPGKYWKSVFRLEHISCWGVIKYNHILHVSSKPCQVFYKRVIVEKTMFSKEFGRFIVLEVEFINKRACILKT